MLTIELLQGLFFGMTAKPNGVFVDITLGYWCWFPFLFGLDDRCQNNKALRKQTNSPLILV